MFLKITVVLGCIALVVLPICQVYAFFLNQQYKRSDEYRECMRRMQNRKQDK